MESSHKDLVSSHDKLLEEKNTLAEQLQAEIELCTEAEEARNRLVQRKAEMEDIIADFEIRFSEEEERSAKAADEKKKLQLGIQDIEERYAVE